MCDSCVSVFLAQVIGIYLFIVSLALIVKQLRFKKILHDFLGDHPLMFLTGIIGVIIGLLIVLFHNVWVSDWPVLVTLIGWITLIQGVARIFYPDNFSKVVRGLLASSSNYLIWSWVWLLIGLYLIWVGFGTN